MCLSPAAYVSAIVYRRLVDRGVDPARAEAVARKVARSYEAQRYARLVARLGDATTSAARL
jgi:hypothetical protein